MDIRIVDTPIPLAEVQKAAAASYGDMVKAVVDVARGVLALGGELHADAEAVLLEQGARQEDLWGINLYPEKPKEERIEFSSLINVKPRQGNMALVIQDTAVQEKIRAVIDRLIAEP